MISRYTIEMNKVEQIIRKKIFWRGLVTSINQTIPFLAYTWALFYGAILIVDGEITYTNVIRLVTNKKADFVFFFKNNLFPTEFVRQFYTVPL